MKPANKQFPKKSSVRANRAERRKHERVLAALEQPDDFVTLEWLRELGFRPASKYTPTHYLSGIGHAMAFRLPGGSYLVHFLEEVSTLVWKRVVHKAHATYLIDNNGTRSPCGEHTRHGILYLLMAQYARIRRTQA